jgi:hypothetical protein
MRACGVFSYRSALMALALLINAQGALLAAEYAPPVDSDLPDAIHGPSADRVPPGLACTDDMDFSPDDNLPSPFDADPVAFHADGSAGTDQSMRPGKPTTAEGCDSRVRLNLI